MNRRGTVINVCVSAQKGTPKQPVGGIRLMKDHGVEGDAHAGTPQRQVSLLCQESADKLRDGGLVLAPGAFAENLRVSGLERARMMPGTFLRFERGAVLQVTQIGKECHTGCAIARAVGRCVMPTEGIFARVVRGGEVSAGDSLEVLSDEADGGGACDQ